MPSMPWQERFWPRVNKDSMLSWGGMPCWEWQAGTTPDGYGKIRVGGKHRLAHRLAYEELVGPIPEGLHLHHQCENPPCVNPAHLLPVPIRVNVLLGKGITAQQARQTHCKHGHAFTEENTYRRNGQRHCRVCRAEATERARKANPAIQVRDNQKRNKRRAARVAAGLPRGS